MYQGVDDHVLAYRKEQVVEGEEELDVVPGRTVRGMQRRRGQRAGTDWAGRGLG